MSDERWEQAQEGAELLREGNVEGAVVELERVIHASPDNEYAYHFLGAAHFEAGRFEKAMKAYVSALEKAPGYVGSMVGLAHTLRMLGRHEQALRMGREILARRAGDPDALYVMGLSHFARGEEAAAIDHLERFLATRPELEVAQEAQGLLQILRGEAQPLDDDG